MGSVEESDGSLRHQFLGIPLGRRTQRPIWEEGVHCGEHGSVGAAGSGHVAARVGRDLHVLVRGRGANWGKRRGAVGERCR